MPPNMAQTTRCKPERFVSPTQTKCRHKGSLLCVGVLKVRAFRCKYVPSIFPYSPWPYTWPWHYMGATWDPCSKKHIKSYKLVPSSRAKESCKSVCEEDPRHRKGVPDWWLLPSQESLVYPWGGGNDHSEKKWFIKYWEILGTTHQQLLIAEIHPNLDCMLAGYNQSFGDWAGSILGKLAMSNVYVFLAGDTVIHCSIYPMMTGNKMSDTTVNLRGSSKTMSLALALPIKMGRNKTHYLYQPQCSHVQRGYTAHVQMHPKNQIKLMTLIQWKYPHCTDIVPLTPNNMPRSVSGLVVQQFDGVFFHNFNECNCSIYDWGLYHYAMWYAQ